LSEERVFFESEGLALEGLISRRPGLRGAVITHPHPLYGGDMHNPVVAALVQAYGRAEFTTLRFNFRGVGSSRGTHGGGVGEQADLRAACDLLAREGKTQVDLAGYSFGAWVIAHALARLPQVRDVVMVSPPAAFMDFSGLQILDRLSLVITGNGDDIAPVDLLERLVPQWNPEAVLKVIPGTDHFYWGKVRELEAVLGEHLAVGKKPGTAAGEER